MKKQNLIALLLAFVWVSLSEFLRNEWLFKELWTAHFTEKGLIFPDAPINGALWGLWSLLYVLFLSWISDKVGFLEAAVVAWITGFVFMWLVIGNLGILPFALLPYAIPLSMLETGLGLWIVRAPIGRKATD